MRFEVWFDTILLPRLGFSLKQRATVQYRKAAGQFRETTSQWGEFCRYLEIADDHFATRQVDVYANGYCLRYDREHWCDEFGMLAESRFVPGSRHERNLVAESIGAAEFDLIWAESKGALNQPQRYDLSKFASVPQQLQMTREQILRLPPWIAELFDGAS